MSGSKKGKGASSGVNKWEDNTLCAIVMADSFNRRLLPLTLEKPRALLPLVNMPLLDYTLEFLSASGVDEVIVFSTSHSDQIDWHLKHSEWKGRTSTLSIRLIKNKFGSLGEVLREVDQKSMIRSDFLLVSADLVTNMDLAPVLAKHRERRKENKDNIMTLVLSEAAPGHRTRPLHEDLVPVIALCPTDSRLLDYQTAGSRNVHHGAQLDRALFEDSPEVQVRYDLMDSHIAICSPEVPPLFSDNFDVETMEQFIRGILDNEDISGQRLHVHTLENEYAARVNSLHSYDAISKDIIHRWTFPIVPDNSSRQDERFKHGRNNIYILDNVVLARSASLVHDVLVGAGTRVGERTRVSESVIGRKCRIGSGVEISESYVWDNVIIGDNVKLHRCIVANRCVIGANAIVPQGCVLSYATEIGPGCELPQRTKLTTKEETFDGTIVTVEKNSELVGKGGKGIVWCANEGESAVDLRHLDWCNDESDGNASDASSLSALSDSDDDEEEDCTVPVHVSSVDRFRTEVFDVMQEGISTPEEMSTDNMVISINGSKHAYNPDHSAICDAIVEAATDVLAKQASTLATNSEKRKAVKRALTVVESVLKLYIGAKRSLQCVALSRLVTACTAHLSLRPLLQTFFQLFYDMDIVGEESILYFAETQLSALSDDEQSVFEAGARPFIDWLSKAETDSESESDDDD